MKEERLKYYVKFSPQQSGRFRRDMVTKRSGVSLNRLGNKKVLETGMKVLETGKKVLETGMQVLETGTNDCRDSEKNEEELLAERVM